MEQNRASVSSVHLQMSYTAQSSEPPIAHPHLPVEWAPELTNWLVLSHFRICHVPCQDSDSPTATSCIWCQVTSWRDKTIQHIPTVQVSLYQHNDAAPADCTGVFISAKWCSICRLYRCLYISKMMQHLPTVQVSLYQQNDAAPADCTGVFISTKWCSTCRLYRCLYIKKIMQHLPTVQVSLYQQNNAAPADCTGVLISAK